MHAAKPRLLAATVVCIVGLLTYPVAGETPGAAPAGDAQQPPRAHEVPIEVQPPAVGDQEVAPPLLPSALRRGRYQSVQVNTDANGYNIIGDAANEPTMAVDPTNPDRIVIGWRQFDTIHSNFRQAGWAYSHDGGRTWVPGGVLVEGQFRTDPVLDVDAQGNFYYHSLVGSALDTCDVSRSLDGGVSWLPPVYAWGGDKNWLVIDRTGGIGHGNIYAIWQRYYNCCDDRTFTRSTDGGNSYMYPVHIPSNPSFGTLAVGPDGTVYAVGIEAINFQDFNQFVVARSVNAQDPSQVPEFTTTPVNLGGSMRVNIGYGPNPDGLLAQAQVVVDHSGGATHGYVYVLCSVDPPGPDRMDVYLIRSSDGGQTWSAPIRVNDDPPAYNSWQWFGTISIAPDGRLDVVWNDTRASGNHRICEVYYSYSLDAGQSWSPSEPITPAFDSYLGWPQQNKLGDYYHMISDALGARLAYAATFEGEQNVYFVRIGTFDCNDNGVHDSEDILSGTSADCNANGIPDECEPDCNGNGVPDDCDVDPADPDGNGVVSPDCNENGIPDECEPGGNEDCNHNGVPDLCDIYTGSSADCNDNGVPDECDLDAGTSADCNGNGIPDECDLASGMSLDCNANGVPDECEIAAGLADDCQPNGILDQCEPTPAADGCADARIVCPGSTSYGSTAGATVDGSCTCADSDTTPDVWYYFQPTGGGLLTVSLLGSWYDTVLSVHTGCPGTGDNQIACNDDYLGQPQSRVQFAVQPGGEYWIRVSGAAGATGYFKLLLTGPGCAYGPECNDNGIPDECEPDCNHNGRPDDCDIADGTSEDANGNGVPDECEGLGDLNCDGTVDELDIPGFVLALINPGAYADTYPECNISNADCNLDGVVDAFDIQPFVDKLTGG